jgi:uncharacterized repeat protein (TIGR03803 family)
MDLKETTLLATDTVPSAAPNLLKRGSAKKQPVIRFALTATVTSLLLMMCISPAHAQTEKLLYSFCGPSGNLSDCTDGVSPQGPLILKGENLYGTAQGSANGYGTVYRLSTGTKIVLTVLHTFQGNPDGCAPLAGVVMDNEDNLYGTTSGCGTGNYGTVYEYSAKKVESVLAYFDGYDGAFPSGPLLIGTGTNAGNLYGTASSGEGTNSFGNVFEVTVSSETLNILDPFNSTDGSGPTTNLVADTEGNLYGMTNSGGANGVGTVFMLSPDLTETVLHSFAQNGIDGYNPAAGLIMNKKGDLFGATNVGGAYGYGVVFELSPPAKAGDPWKETILHTFNHNDTDGYFPDTTLIMDKKENLYGTTRLGGNAGYGTVYELLVPAKSGDPWTETILHNFPNNSTDANSPTGGLVMDSKGNLYGTGGNGAYLRGAIYEVTP